MIEIIDFYNRAAGEWETKSVDMPTVVVDDPVRDARTREQIEYVAKRKQPLAAVEQTRLNFTLPPMIAWAMQAVKNDMEREERRLAGDPEAQKAAIITGMLDRHVAVCCSGDDAVIDDEIFPRGGIKNRYRR
jgi:hypothetical protein